MPRFERSTLPTSEGSGLLASSTRPEMKDPADTHPRGEQPRAEIAERPSRRCSHSCVLADMPLPLALSCALTGFHFGMNQTPHPLMRDAVEVPASTLVRSPLTQHLLDAAAHHASRCYQLIESGPSHHVPLDIAQHGGACVELLAKAIVAHEHAALLVDPKDANSQPAILARGREVRIDDFRKVSTIGASSALKMASAVLRGSVPGDEAQLLIERNAAVHAALAPLDVTRLGDRLASWLRSVLPSLNVDLASFLGPEASKYVEVRFSESRISAQQAVLGARHRFESLLKSVPSGSWLKVKAEKEKAPLSEHHDFDDVVTCPACASDAHVLGILDVWDEYDGPGETSLDWTIEAVLRCGVCGLTLIEPQMMAIDISDWGHDWMR